MRKCLNGKSHIGFRVPWLRLHSVQSTHRLKKASTQPFCLLYDRKERKHCQRVPRYLWTGVRIQEEQSDDLILWSNSPSRSVLQMVFLRRQALRRAHASEHSPQHCLWTRVRFRNIRDDQSVYTTCNFWCFPLRSQIAICECYFYSYPGFFGS